LRPERGTDRAKKRQKEEKKHVTPNTQQKRGGEGWWFGEKAWKERTGKKSGEQE